MNCTHCGNPLPDNTKFCPKCGQTVAASNDNAFDSAETTILGQGQAQQSKGYQQQAPNAGNRPPQYSNPQPQQAPVNVYMPSQQQMDPTDLPVSVGGWIGVFLLSCLPIVSIIMLFIWAFSSSTKKSLKNYARAVLIMALIAIVLVIIISIILAAAGVSVSYGYRH